MKKDAKTLIGEIGEDIVYESFKFAQKTSDWYDAVKDGMIGPNLMYEVKTARLNYRDQGFWMAENQWKKLDGCDILFFVKVPEEVEEGLRLYQMTNHRENFNVFTHKNIRYRNYWFTKCMPCDIITDERVKTVVELSKSLQTWSPK